MKDLNDYLLTAEITVGDLKAWIGTKDATAKEKIIELIHHRFYNRYVKHVERLETGFLIMGVSCLMIETIESFKQGLKDTKAKGVGKKMFKDFFQTNQENFPGFAAIAGDFYSDIRCGILHQAETTKGWRILRKGRILNLNEKAINANAFIRALNSSLDSYIEDLRNSEFAAPVWNHALFKLEDICENCKSD